MNKVNRVYFDLSVFTNYSFRSSRLQLIFKVAVRNNLAKLLGKHFSWSSISLKLETVNSTIKNFHQIFSPVNFGTDLWAFTSILKAITVLLLLHFDSCPAEAMILFTKQMNNLSNQSYRGAFVKLFGQKSRNFPRNMSAVELCFDKITWRF